MRKKVLLCMTSDIVYDRRMLRISESLADVYDVQVVSRKLHEDKFSSEAIKAKRIACVFNKGFLFYAEFNLRLFFILLGRSYDIITSVDYDTLLACAIAKGLRGKKLVFDAHEYFEESVEIISRKNVQRFWTRIGRFGLKRVDLAYTVSETIAGIYEEMHNLPFETIRNLPSISDTDLSSKESGKAIVLYQGALNKGRKLEQLIEAAEILGNEVEFWIVGEGDESEKLKAKEVSNVKFFSWVKPSELISITKNASLGYNLLDATSKSYYLSLANKFFDYMHAGVPSLNNAFPEYLKLNERYNCCFTYNLDSADELSKFLDECLENPGLLEEKSKNSLLAARDLSWEKEEQKLKKIYRTL